jgi:hypothetical protein
MFDTNTPRHRLFSVLDGCVSSGFTKLLHVREVTVDKHDSTAFLIVFLCGTYGETAVVALPLISAVSKMLPEIVCLPESKRWIRCRYGSPREPAEIVIGWEDSGGTGTVQGMLGCMPAMIPSLTLQEADISHANWLAIDVPTRFQLWN